MRLVVKTGATALLDEQFSVVSRDNLRAIASTVAELRRLGNDVVVVSSGAVGLGMRAVQDDPAAFAPGHDVNALGQQLLMAAWTEAFAEVDIEAEQVLVTAGELREAPDKARLTMEQMLERGVIPIVNENDALPSKSKLSDNDTLAGLLCVLLGGQWLFLLSAADALYSADPRVDPKADRYPTVGRAMLGDLLRAQTEMHDGAKLNAVRFGQWRNDSVLTKLRAAHIVTGSAAHAALLSHTKPAAMLRLLEGADEGTVFLPGKGGATGYDRACSDIFATSTTASFNDESWLESELPFMNGPETFCRRVPVKRPTMAFVEVDVGDETVCQRVQIGHHYEYMLVEESD